MDKDTIENAKECDPATTRRHRGSRPLGVKYATGHTDVTHQAQCGQNVTGDSKTPHCPHLRKKIRLGTWNVRGTIQPGKKEILNKEQLNYNLDILGMTETHMRGSGFYTTNSGQTIYFSGPDNDSSNGVAFSVSPKINKAILGYNPVNDRIMTIKINTKPCRLNIVLVYAPTSSSTVEDIEAFYNQLEDCLRQLPKRDITIIMGDLNAKVGSTTSDNHLRGVVGKFGLGTRNDRGEMWLQFCTENALTITNSCFEQHPRRLYTWVSPDGRTRNQIDYIAIAQRWRSCIRSTKTYPGADCGSDHKLLVAEIMIKLKKCNRNMHKPQKRLTQEELQNFKAQLQSQDLVWNETASVESNWNLFKDSVISSRKGARNATTDAPKKCWITEGTWKVIKERKMLLEGNMDCNDTKYRELSAKIQRLCRRDKNHHYNSMCQDIERHAQNMHPRDFFTKVKSITRGYKAKTWAIEDDRGTLLTEIEHVTERWRLYCESLYSKQNNPNPSTSTHMLTDGAETEPYILESELKDAIRKLKNNKSAGRDTILAEEIKHLEEKGTQMLLGLCNQIWKTGQWINDWKESMLIPLHKKGSTRACGNFRTVALISHASKVMLYIINERLKHYLQWQIPNEQAGFVKGRGTREQIVNVRLMIEKAREFNVPMLMCFIDYSKAFDCVQWDCLWKILREMGVPEHLILLISNLYQDGNSVVRVNDVISNPFHPEKGVRQGCILSPLLFNIYGEYIMRKALDNWEGGISIGGIKISNLRYADDTTLFASSESELAELIRKVETESERVGLNINKSKTKIMIVDRADKLTLTGKLADLEIVNEFVYLGSMLSDRGGSDREIRRRTQMAKDAMSKLKNIWQDRNISNGTKVRLVRTLVFPIFLYGSESWIIRVSERKKIDAFEMWCWRRMLRIPWTAKRTNKSILEQLSITTRLSTVCFKQLLNYFGHVARREPSNLEKNILLGRVQGKRSRGRAPHRWSDQIKGILNLPITTALRRAEDREEWRNLVANTAKNYQIRHDLQ